MTRTAVAVALILIATHATAQMARDGLSGRADLSVLIASRSSASVELTRSLYWRGCKRITCQRMRARLLILRSWHLTP